MKIKKKRILSLILAVSMMICMMPTTAMAAEPLIEGTTGAGTKSDPVIVDTFAELKTALQYVGDLYIRMDEFKPSLEGLTYETLKEGTHYTNDESAIKVPANYTKHLELNADVDCRATETEKALYSFITNVGTLYITGTGSLRVSFNATAYPNAIIYNMAPGMVQIGDNVTFDATQKSIQCHGYAVINYSGTLNITGGIFKGENSGPTSSRIAAVSADMGTTNISGGTFEAAVTGSGGGTGYGLIIKDSAAVTLTGGSFKGFYLPESKTLANYYDTEKYVVTEEDGWTTITDPSVVKSVSLTLPEPTDGGNPTTPTCATDNVTIGTCEWILDSTVLSSDATFENGRTYRCGVIIYPKSGYTLDKNATVTINGRPMTVQMQNTSYINCYIDFTITAAPISSIALSVTAPVAGGTPSAPSCDMKSVMINSYEWTGLGASGTFENGNTYRCVVLIYPESGYTFDENATVTINGRPMTVQDQYTSYINCYIDFTITASPEYTINVTNGKATDGAGTEITKTAEGTEVTLTANAAPADKVFDKWVVESDNITLADANSASTTFIMPADAVSVQATYCSYITINLAAGDGSGSMEPIILKLTTSGYYLLTAPECTFTPPTNKVFDKWMCSTDSTYLNPGKTKTLWSADDGMTLTAIWKDAPVTERTITVTNGKATDVAGTEISQAAEGTEVTLTANAAPADKVFDKWVVEDGSASITLADANSATTTFTMPAGAVSVKATYKDKTISGGGGYIPPVQKPTIEAGEGVKVTLSADGTVATITVDPAYELADVVLNGTSKGKVTEVKGLKTGDKLVVTAAKKATEPTKEDILAALADYQLVARSKVTTSPNGKKAILITWYDKNGKELNFDGVEIFRSVKRNSGYGKKPVFTSVTGKYYNTAITKGTRYYYKVRGFVVINGQKYYTDYSLKAIRTAK